MVSKTDIVSAFNDAFSSTKEYKDLDEFEKLYALLLLNSSGSSGNPNTTTERIPTLLKVTTAGTIAAGSTYLSFYNAGSTNALVLGTVLDPGLSISIPTRSNETLAAVSYDATGTILVIVRTI